MNDHDRIEELVAVRALGGLEPPDADELARVMDAHGPSCEECRRLRTEYDEVAGRLAFALEPTRVRDGFEDEVFAAATGRPSRPADVRPPRRSSGLRPLVAVAASLVLFAAGWAIGTRSGPDVPSGARVVAFEGEGGSLSAAYRPGESGVYLLGSGLEPLDEGEVYEVWMIRGETPVPVECFTPAADGSVFSFLDADVASADLMAVTVEASTCPEAPTTPPVLVAEITV